MIGSLASLFHVFETGEGCSQPGCLVLCEICVQSQVQYLAWQHRRISSGYNQCSRVEAQMGRWKGVVGPKLKARGLENQKTEVKIAANVLNKMAELGHATFEVIS